MKSTYKKSLISHTYIKDIICYSFTVFSDSLYLSSIGIKQWSKQSWNKFDKRIVKRDLKYTIMY